MLNLMEDTLVPCEKVHTPVHAPASTQPLASTLTHGVPYRQIKVLLRTIYCIHEKANTHRRQTRTDDDAVIGMSPSNMCALLSVMTPLLALVFPAGPGADEFLPVLILVVANCHLRHPATAVALIRHLTPDADLHGEVLYYLTAFESAL